MKGQWGSLLGFRRAWERKLGSVGGCDVPHGLSRLKKTICQIKCSLLAWWAVKRYSRQHVCEHPSSSFPVHPVINSFFRIPQLSPSFTFIPGEWVDFALCQGPKRHSLSWRDTKADILQRGSCCGLSLHSSSTSEKRADPSWKSIQNHSPCHVCFPSTWSWRGELGRFINPLFKLRGW